jgi:hypothetical protein
MTNTTPHALSQSLRSPPEKPTVLFFPAINANNIKNEQSLISDRLTFVICCLSNVKKNRLRHDASELLKLSIKNTHKTT